MMGSGRAITEMGGVCRRGRMGRGMRASGCTIRRMGRGSSFMWMVIYLRGSGSRIRLMVLGCMDIIIIILATCI